jgi:hypothetical protein
VNILFLNRDADFTPSGAGSRVFGFESISVFAVQVRPGVFCRSGTPLHSSILDTITGIAPLQKAGANTRALHDLLSDCERSDAAVFLFGSDEQVVYQLRDKVGSAFPRLKIAGICDADFEGPATREVVEHIANARPDVIIVDMAPRIFRAFARDHASQFAGASLVNLPATFRSYALPGRVDRYGPRSLAAGDSLLPRAMRRGVGQVLDGGRFARVILGQFVGQFVHGTMRRLRTQRPAAVPRRDV